MDFDRMLRYCTLLEQNNNRVWFHKKDNHALYTAAKEEFTELLVELQFRLSEVVAPDLAERLRPDYDLASFTGYTWEGLMARAKEDPEILRLLGWLDVVVDGPFVQALRDRNLLFRGSGNQRILDVKASLAAGEAVWTKDPAWVGEDCSARAEG